MSDPLPVHAFPAPDPFPVAGVAFAAPDNLGSALGFRVCYQGGKDGGSFIVGLLAFFYLFHGEAFFHKARIVLTAHEAMRIHHGLVEGDVGAHAHDAIFLQCAAHAQDGLGARFAPDDQLGDHRVVIRRDLETGIYARVHADARTGGQQAVRDAPGGWQEIIIRIFGVDAAFDGMTVEFDIFLFVAQLPSARDADLLRHNVHACDHLGDGMLHLQAGVHFKEIKILVFVYQEFDCPGVDIVHSLWRL